MSILRRSLALKLVLAFLIVSVTGVGLTASLARWATYREFQDLVIARSRENFVSRAVAYYEAQGSWAGIARHMHDLAPPIPLEHGSRRPPPQPIAFTLVTPDGEVLAPSGPHRSGDQIPASTLARGTTIEIDGNHVGTILTTGKLPELDAQEEAYVAQITRVSVIAGLGATAIALVLGGLLARTLTRPIQDLTQATEAVAAGKLDQRVPVRTEDELGTLATAFNQMSADLARATAARRQMTADIAHDLRSPLTVIGGYLESMRDGVLKPTPERFETMYNESQHLLRLVDDLRTLSLADAGELTLNRVAVPPAALLRRVAKAYGHAAKQASVSLQVVAEETLPDLLIDPDRIAQVLGNLVSNALRYTPPQGMIKLGATADGGSTHLTVADTGVGIPAEALPHIFDRFYRVDAARSDDTGSSGLGLAIAKSLIEAHGGTISVDSKAGQGTVFDVALPLTQQAD